MRCDRCAGTLEPIFSYKFPDEPKRVHLYICTNCLCFLQEYKENGEVSYSLWGTFH
jgi:hypothetical protein